VVGKAVKEIIKGKEYKILIGVFTLIILLILMGPPDFYNWLLLTFLGYMASIFFIMPIVNLILTLKPTKELMLSLIGIIILTIYAIALNLTLKDIIVIILQTIVVVSLISLFIPAIKKEIMEEL